MRITVPAGQVAAGQLPHICPRHGEQPIEMKKVRLVSKPPPWAAVLILRSEERRVGKECW